MIRHKPAAIFLVVVIVGGIGTALYLQHVKRRISATPITVTAAAPAETPQASEAAPVSPPPPEVKSPVVVVAKPAPSPAVKTESRRLYFRHTGVDGHYGQLAWVDISQRQLVHYVDSLRCEVVYVAGGRGICLTADRGVFTTYSASLFDARNFQVSSGLALKGIPSRARVSLDGSLAAFTVFVAGHGYTTLDFSTQTLLLDARSGRALANLEDFEVTRDSQVIKAADFNFWGVTFAPDARTFFATLSTGGKHFLIRGDIAAHRATVIHENVECPSLSPDARNVAYKKRFMINDRVVWQLHVLELASGRETALSERRSIDDQLEWLDNRHVLYSVPSAEDGSSPSTDVWRAAVDGKTAPELFVRDAYSPATARP
jgi:hypothetical protein